MSRRIRKAHAAAANRVDWPAVVYLADEHRQREIDLVTRAAADLEWVTQLRQTDDLIRRLDHDLREDQ